jgi:hypothetical protein
MKSQHDFPLEFDMSQLVVFVERLDRLEKPQIQPHGFIRE